MLMILKVAKSSLADLLDFKYFPVVGWSASYSRVIVYFMILSHYILNIPLPKRVFPLARIMGTYNFSLSDLFTLYSGQHYCCYYTFRHDTPLCVYI